MRGKVRYNYKYLYGYRKGEDGKPETIPKEAETVRMIYQMFLNGYSMGNIAKYLNEINAVTKMGKGTWRKGIIQSILILTAINEYYDCKDSIRELLKANVEQAIAGINMNEAKIIQHRLREIDEARNDYISLIATGTINESSLDEQFQMLYDEEQELNTKLKSLQNQNNIDLAKRSRVNKAIQEIDSNSCELTEYNDLLVRKLIEYVKVVSKTEIQIIFKGGINTTIFVEK